jgi:hypothetical protein
LALYVSAGRVALGDAVLVRSLFWNDRPILLLLEEPSFNGGEKFYRVLVYVVSTGNTKALLSRGNKGGINSAVPNADSEIYPSLDY